MVANFKVKNPARPANEPWTADSTTKIRSAGGLELEVGEVTVKTFPYQPHDIWNHQVTMPLHVRSNGVVLTNWSASYVRVEDASGNWDYFGSHRSLDPKYVWKLEADFEPDANSLGATLATVEVPVSLSAPLVTNVASVSVKFSWVNGNMLAAEMSTNRADLALKLVSACDSSGKDIQAGFGSWHQHGFWKGLNLSGNSGSVRATIAVVPNIHVTFFTQPQRDEGSGN